MIDCILKSTALQKIFAFQPDVYKLVSEWLNAKIDIFFLIAGTQSFAFSFMLYNKRHRSTADRLLATFFLSTAVYLILCWISYKGAVPEKFYLIIYFHQFYLLIGPFIYLYTCLAVSPKPAFRRSYYWHFLPFIVHYAVDAGMFVTYGKLVWLQRFYVYHPVSAAEYYVRFFSLPVYIVLTLMKLKKFSHELTDNFSYTEKIDLQWLKIMLGCFIGAYISVIVLYITNIVLRVHIPVDFNTTIAFIFSCTMVFIGYASYRQKEIFSSEEVITAEPSGDVKPELQEESQLFRLYAVESTSVNKKEKEGLKPEEYKDYYDRLLEFMNIYKEYLNPELSLALLARKLEVSTHKLSATINMFSGSNFFDFVNNFRIEEVKTVLARSENLTSDLVSTGLECGFNSKASFFRIFKKHTGMTPQQYHKYIHRNEQATA